MAMYLSRFIDEDAGLAFSFKVNPESCGNNSHYEEYLRFCAITDQKSGKGVTHVLVDECADSHKKAIVGFITLKASCLNKRYENYISGHPSIEIAELAVDMDFEGNGYGTDLVNYAYVVANKLRHEYAGIEYIVTCADPVSEFFYGKFGFSRLEDYYEVPREGWNVDCIPMFHKLPELKFS